MTASQTGAFLIIIPILDFDISGLGHTIMGEESGTEAQELPPRTPATVSAPTGEQPAETSTPVNAKAEGVETEAAAEATPPVPPKALPTPPVEPPTPDESQPQASPQTATTPPPPPPKSSADSKPQPPVGAPIRTESVASMSEVSLSRNGTPARPKSAASTTSYPDVHSPGPSRRMDLAHSRRSSTATTISLAPTAGNGPRHQLSSVLITPPLKVLVDSKEAKKSASFHAAATRALELCQGESAFLHPREIFEPLRLAISNPQTTSVPILITSLDLLSKLISHSFFSEPYGPPKGMSPLPDLITHTITLSYSEHSPPQVALQVVKALMAIVLSTDKGMLVHQSSLLKAVRTVYNVFLLSTDGANQVVAQGGLTQMVHHVFGRVIRPDPRSAVPRKSFVGENEARRAESTEPDETFRSDSVPPTPRQNGGQTPKEPVERVTLYVTHRPSLG